MSVYRPIDWKYERPYVVGSLLLLVFLYAPYWLLGQDAYFLIHDFLDDSSYNFGPLVLSGQAFNFRPDATVPPIMNGLPRSGMHSGLYASVWFFALLPPFWAILVNFLLVHALGFVGMYALMRTYILIGSGVDSSGTNPPNERLLAAGVALIFALIPTYSNYGLSVMGQPLLLLAFLNVLNGRANPRRANPRRANPRRAVWGSWAIIIAFPFYSFLVRSGLYVLVGLGIIGLVDMVQNRRFNRAYWLGLMVLAGLYVLVDFPMIGAYLGNQFVSHRTEYDPTLLISSSFVGNLKNIVLLFVQGQYHSGLFCPLLISIWWVWWFVRAKQKTALPFWLMVAIVVICLLHGLYPLLITRSGIPQRLLTVFQLDRFYFLLPLLWTVLLGLLLYNVAVLRWVGRPITTAFFGLSAQRSTATLYIIILLTLALNKEWTANARTLIGIGRPARQPSYRAFFAENLFHQIKRTLPGNLADYRVVSIGMHPIIAQANGFYTLDSYQNNYPLAYKHQFRQIMAAEWANPEARSIRPYFDAYGNRCYIFPAELRMDCLIGKTENRVVTDLQFDNLAFREMGGRYIFSAVAIKNAASLGWRQVGVFNDSASYWRVWVYAV